MISGKILRDAIISGANNINNQRSRVDELHTTPEKAKARGEAILAFARMLAKSK